MDTNEIFKKVADGDGAILKFAQQQGIDLKTLRNFQGQTVLMPAALNGKMSPLKIGLNAGVDVNAADERLNTPLHMTAHHAQVLAACYLLVHGADTSARNENGMTPLDLARYFAKYDRYHMFDTYLLLLEQAAHTDAPRKIIDAFKNPFGVNIRGIIEQEIRAR